MDGKNFLFEAELELGHRFPLHNVFSPIRMYIHNDRLILYQSNTSNYSPDIFFASYLLSDDSYQGIFGVKGRGYGEWIFPIFIQSTNNTPYLYLTDMSMRQTTAVIHKMILDSITQLKAISSYIVDKEGYNSMNNMVINKDSLLVYDEFASAPVLKVHHLGRNEPVKSWKYGAFEGNYNSAEYIAQIQFDENRGVHVANDSCIVFLYRYQDRIDIMDWNFKLKKRLNYQKNKPVIHKSDPMDNVVYYSNAFLGERFLYAFYHGMSFKEHLTASGQRMDVFDLNGTPVCSYTFCWPAPVIFTVDERTFTLYGYRGDSGLEDSISIYHLPQLREYLKHP